ncbi:hypothetical protein HID58_065339, partial [Brassica napus]
VAVLTAAEQDLVKPMTALERQRGSTVGVGSSRFTLVSSAPNEKAVALDYLEAGFTLWLEFQIWKEGVRVVTLGAVSVREMLYVSSRSS